MKNKYLFYWHALFLAFTKNFTDLNTVIPAVFIIAGGSDLQLGILSAITIGGQRFTQLLFGTWLSGKIYKKSFLLAGINLRIASLAALGIILYFAHSLSGFSLLALIFLFMALFSVSGAFANIPYTDILGKSLETYERKQFFVKRQTIRSVGILISALVVRQLLISYNFPVNYSLLFIMAAGMLLIGSGGFWKLKERPSQLQGNQSTMIQTLKTLPQTVKSDKNLLYFLILGNLLGVSLAVIPFYLAMAKNTIGLSATLVGNLLLVQIVGMVLSNIVWQRLSRRKGYKAIIYSIIVINTLLPFGVFFFSAYALAYPFIFFFSGFSLSAYEIISGAVLIEISTDENRPLYTGLSGVGSLLLLIYPLMSGFIVSNGSFSLLMAITVFISAAAFWPGIRLNCLKNG